MISKIHNVSVAFIILENKLVPPYKLEEGQRLHIPMDYIHRVDKGENFGHIANMYGMDGARLAEYNNIRKIDQIVEGDPWQKSFGPPNL